MDLASASNVIASSDMPNIAQGGVSSSSVLNKIHNNVRTDIITLDNSTDTLLEEVSDLVTIATQQASALSVAYSTLSSELTSVYTALATGATPRTRMSMYLPVVTDDSATTVNINKKYGQATLPISGETDWFSTKDLEGNVYIPDQTKLKIAITSSVSSYQDLSSDDYWEVENYKAAFDKNDGTVWYYDVPRNTTGDTYLAVWMDVPSDLLLGLYANCLELSPFPLLTHDLVDVTFILSDGTTSAMDFTDYSIPGYDQATGSILSAGNIRFLFAPMQVVAVKFLMKLNSGYSFAGLTDVSLKTIHFGKSGVLSLDISDLTAYNVASNGKTNVTTALVGDMQSYLSTITPATDSSIYTIKYNLSQISSGLTPVITAVDITWS